MAGAGVALPRSWCVPWRLTIELNVLTINSVCIEFDPDKRAATPAACGVDFARASEVFAGLHYTAADERPGYVEDRFITVGLLDGRMVVLVWTPRGEGRCIISMRKANDREQARHAHRFD